MHFLYLVPTFPGTHDIIAEKGPIVPLACLPSSLLHLLVAAGEVSEGEGGVSVRDSLHDCVVDEGVLLLGGKRREESSS